MNQPGPSGRNLFDVFEVDGYSDASDDQSDIELDLEEQSNDEEDCSGGEKEVGLYLDLDLDLVLRISINH